MNDLLSALPSDTKCFIVLITGIAIYFHTRFNSQIIVKAPAILTTLGIFFTFFGIAKGLVYFDVSNIQKSVPDLIDGIKTAFWASVAGVFWALTIKCRDVIWGHKKTPEAEGSTIDDLASLLISIDKSVSENGSGKAIIDLLTSLKSLVAGDSDSTLVGQLKLIRQDSNDKLGSLEKTLQGFYEKIADNNSKALIEALKEVIRDFNSKINEQFGDNFKQLNEAVGKMLEWQQRYRLDMDKMIEDQSKATKNMAEATFLYSQILDKTSTFTDTADKLSHILNGLELQRNHLHSSLSSFAILLDKAGSEIPKLEEKISEMAKQTFTSVDNCQSHLRDILIEGLRVSNEEFNKNIKELVEKTKEQVLVLDKALTDELTKSLEGFGKQMAALSQKFASDYSPITDGLRSILQIGKIE